MVTVAHKVHRTGTLTFAEKKTAIKGDRKGRTNEDT